jgi:hypothetical protein
VSKKKKTGHPVKNLALSPDEQERVDAGLSIHASLLGKLLTAWRQDFRDVLFSIGPDMVKPEDLGSFGNGPEHLRAIRQRLSLGLSYTLSDCDNASEIEGFNLSYEHGIESVLSLARILLPRHLIQDWKGHEHADDVESLQYEIDGCIIALLTRGKLQHAADLIRLAGCVMAIDRSQNCVISGSFRKESSTHTDDIHKLKVLLALHVILKRGEIPTKMRLRQEFFVSMDASNFSVMLRGLQIRDLLPDEPRGRRSEGGHKGGSFPAVIRSGSDEELRKYRESKVSSRSADETGEGCDRAFVIDLHSQWSSSDPAMIDHYIRVIRAKLGSLYPLLLIESGMTELEDADDLREFERRLSERGLRLS